MKIENLKSYEVITNGLKVKIELNKYDERTLPVTSFRPIPRTIPAHLKVSIEAERSMGHIEGYFEFRICDHGFYFEDQQEALLFAEAANANLIANGVRTEFVRDPYYVQECYYQIWIDGVTDEREREHREEMEDNDYYKENE